MDLVVVKRSRVPGQLMTMQIQSTLLEKIKAARVRILSYRSLESK